MIDPITYKNQREACRLTWGLVPHPMFNPVKSPSGLPFTSPLQVCLLGRWGMK